MMPPFWRSLMEIARAVGQMRDDVDPKQPEKRKRSPAVTPTPSPRLPPSPEPSVIRWKLETISQIKISADASLTMGRLTGKPLFGDATWAALLGAQVVRIREADAGLRGILPPEECREAQAVLLSASADGLLSAEHFLKGIQQFDPDLLEQGEEYMTSSSAKMNLFWLMVDAMTP